MSSVIESREALDVLPIPKEAKSAIAQSFRQRKEGTVDAERVCVELARFLTLCAVAEGPLSPPTRIDDAWHILILHTEAYSRYCEAAFGQFIHHRPSSESKGFYADTYTLAEAAFVVLDPDIWPSPHDTDNARATEAISADCTSP